MNKDTVLKQLAELVAIESVSADPNRFDQMLRAVELLTHKLTSLGFTVKTHSKENNPPLIVAHRTTNKNATTIGIYGHYDVQPEDPVDEWNTIPFQATIKNGKIWGRGVADNKGHIIQNLSAIEELIANNELKSNVVFILEGEEERGSSYLEDYAKEAKDILAEVDVFYITDVGMHAKNEPYIFYGLRGLVSFELEVSIGKRDLHSGEFGNRVLNAVNVLCDVVAKIKDVHTGKVLVPGFYDDVRKIPQSEIDLLDQIKKTDEEEQAEAQSYGVVSLDKKYPHLSSKIYPSFDVNGMIGGYTGPGGKTIIPKSARCIFTCRLVEHQDPKKIEQLVADFIKGIMPSGVKYRLESGGVFPFYTDIDNEYVAKTKAVLDKVFGNETKFNRSGGTIPAAEIFQRLFKKPIILTGFVLPDENMHSPNENFDEEMFWKGIEALKEIYKSI